VVHHQLTLDAALRYAAELRLPRATKEERATAVCRVLAELELTRHAHTRVDKLSGGQRKRASVAMELLTGPSLLILDEPTTGLDPALDRQVMTMLRRLADAGRVVLVVTHCLTYLDVCDQVLFLTPGGKTAYCGPPDDIGDVLGSTDWADLFTRVGADPEAAHRDFLTRCRAHAATPPRRRSPAAPAPCRLLQQASTVARRHGGSSWPIGALSSFWRCCRSSSARCRCWCPAIPGWAPPTRVVMPPMRRHRSSCCSTSAPCSWAPR
jgi:ABC transport system ATP-binding/permease protein